jgi:outer membrane receptor protein involved in Fe transport
MAHRYCMKPTAYARCLRVCVLLLACVLALPAVRIALAASNGKISGHVVDAKTREPLIGVNVTLVGTTRGAATDVQGDFDIPNIDVGVYSLKASQVGYKDVLLNNVRVRSDATTQVRFEMEQTVLEGQEVVVTAQRPVIQKDNTATRMYIESTDITSRPATSVTDVVSTLPSINIDNGVMSVRGGLMDEVAFIVDGARARNPMNQEAFTSVNLSAVQEMEVITGSYNAEYGEARSGVFNVITKEGGKKYTAYGEFRYTPPGVHHWGVSLYDQGTSLFWENSHARHLQWWIDHPDQWVDPNGLFGNDPKVGWTPEQAYNNYIATHQPLTDYADVPGLQGEISVGGPVPFLSDMTFFLSGKYSVQPPLMGNAFAKKGKYFDGSGKLTYMLDPATKLQFSGFVGNYDDSWGYGDVPYTDWATNYGLAGRYAYYDYNGLPKSETDGETLKLTRVVSDATMWEAKLSRVFAARSTDVLPGDPIGWDATGPTYDYLRAVEPAYDSAGHFLGDIPVPGGYQNIIGYHTLGYYYRYNDKNTDWTATGYYQSQINKYWQVKAGAEFTYYHLNHFNEAKSPDRLDQRVYTPWQGAVYEQNKAEFSGFIMNLGFRFDFYNPNDYLYPDVYDPLEGPTEKTKTFTQFSPRLGISHPIDENTVLHFSYGHFFERGTFGDYGEGQNEGEGYGILTTMIVEGSDPLFPWVLGNRAQKPVQTIAYELGIERNFFDEFLLTVTGYYKDIRNTVRVVTVISPYGTYRTNGNADYGDVKGVEISLRKQASHYSWGSLWGYANYTTQQSITGSSGSPNVIKQSGDLYPISGDVIYPTPPRFKGGIYYETPQDWQFLGGAFSRLSLSLDYWLTMPNKEDLSDVFVLNGVAYPRPPDQNLNARIRKDFAFGPAGKGLRLGIYAEVRNVTNFQSLNLDLFRTASDADQARMVNSNFKDIPTVDANGTPYLDLARFRNLPRSVIFGITMEL